MRIYRVSPEEKERIIELLSVALAAEPDVVFAYLLFMDPSSRPRASGISTWRSSSIRSRRGSGVGRGSWRTNWKGPCAMLASLSP